MKLDFQEYLNKNKEVGFVEKSVSSLVYARGLPGAKPSELVVFESGDVGQVLALSESSVELMSFSREAVKAGTRVARTDSTLKIPVGEELLGSIIDPLGHSADPARPLPHLKDFRKVEVLPPGIQSRVRIRRPCNTGITLIDLMVPLGKGQRELVIGDQKTGKSRVLLRALLAQVKEGAIGIYAVIGKGQIMIRQLEESMRQLKIADRSVLVVSSSDDPASAIFLTPYTAMTIAEYFRDKGKDVMLVLDDLTVHAKIYREIALLGRRYPGRSSYPGDIFYVHARLLERAGNFKVGEGEAARPGEPERHSEERASLMAGGSLASPERERSGPPKEAAITCLPVAETVQGDFTGYIQTNLMSMTDGHLFFDHDFFVEGRRPAIDPFLSVTRVGFQTQSVLKLEIARELTAFLKNVERMHTFASFGAELGEHIKTALAKEDRLMQVFDQTAYDNVLPNLQLFLFGLAWGDIWKGKNKNEVRLEIQKMNFVYETRVEVRAKIDEAIEKCKNMDMLVKRASSLTL